MGQPKVVKAIYELMVRGSEWSEEIFEVLYESIWYSYNLFPESDRTVRIRKWRDSVETSVIKWTLDALDGNMMSLGFVADITKKIWNLK